MFRAGAHALITKLKHWTSKARSKSPSSACPNCSEPQSEWGPLADAHEAHKLTVRDGATNWPHDVHRADVHEAALTTRQVMSEVLNVQLV